MRVSTRARTDLGGGEVDQDDVDSAAVLTLVGEPEGPTPEQWTAAIGAAEATPGVFPLRSNADRGCRDRKLDELMGRCQDMASGYKEAMSIKERLDGALKSVGDGIVSIDPGSSSGAIVATAACWDEPKILRLAKSTDRDIVDFIREVTPYCRYGVIERVSSMPKQGIASAFKFGASYGGLKMVLAVSDLIWGEVTPSQWQRALGCLSKGDKNITKSRAQQLFPNVKVIHHNADALLLNHWGKLHAKWVERGNIAVR